MNPDAAKKRVLLEQWLKLHAAHRLPFHEGGPLDAAASLSALRGHVQGVHESVYVLVRRSAPTRPLYIGKAGNPVTRWQSHLRKIQQGGGSYGAWTVLFADPLDLYVVPVFAMQSPPIPCFPVTLGAVENQLISLSQDAFPGLLNRDGVGR
jgi:hypothetical protein